jgi:hypothetical protein
MITNPTDDNNSSAVRKHPLQNISWCRRFTAVLQQSNSNSLQSDNLGFGMGFSCPKLCRVKKYFWSKHLKYQTQPLLMSQSLIIIHFNILLIIK